MSWTLKVRDKFQAAHCLRGYKGKCEKIHGHSFQVEIEIGVGELDRTGIGIDFTDIKKRLAEILPDVYPFNPSAENLSRHLYDELKKFYPVKAVTVWESDDASATYSEDH
jgi:6-pyruvoyltetrahydropterin/6-carboxytetrahydropterin synthase